MSWDSKHLRTRLLQSGYSDSALLAAWPGWWSDEAESSISAQTELRFSIARKLGIDPRSLLEDDEPTYVWKGEAKFKHLSSESESEQSALSSYGIAVGRILAEATQEVVSLSGVSALELRTGILAHKPFVSLLDLLGLCWGVGVPVIHLKVFPLNAKHMCAMAVRNGNRFSILLGKDASYPAAIAFYLAHELGHIALGHLRDDSAVVDLSDPLDTRDEEDVEERDADRFALELLTGMPELKVDTQTHHFTAEQLSFNLLQTSQQARVEPGTLALCFGYTTGDWPKANAAMKRIYTEALPVWKEVNGIALAQLDWSALPDDLASFLRAILGGLTDDSRGD